MSDDPRARRDGVTIAPGHSPGKAWLALAGAAVVAAAAVFALFRTPPPADHSDPPVPPAVATASESPRIDPPARQERVDRHVAAPAPPAPAVRESAPAPEVPVATDADAEAPTPPTVPSGIGLFPPRGSDPVRVGIAVPDDFQLPEGFMRHYQVTDDGQDVPPILVVHPDYELLDAHGNPVPRPEGGVVPPELAPPGMPIETVVIPEPLDESAP